MRLGNIFFYRVDLIPHRFRGKHRKIKKPMLKDLFQLKYDFEREQRNMLLLKYPYLTPQQSYGHMTELRKEFPSRLELWVNEKNEKYNKRITIADRLNHLKVTECWD